MSQIKEQGSKICYYDDSRFKEILLLSTLIYVAQLQTPQHIHELSCRCIWTFQVTKQSRQPGLLRANDYSAIVWRMVIVMARRANLRKEMNTLGRRWKYFAQTCFVKH